MIGLTCSWAWSIGLVRSPPPLCLLTSLIAEGRRGLSLSASLSFPLFFPPFLSRSIPLSLCLLSLMTNLSAAPVVAGCEYSACDWMTQICFFTMKASLPVQWAFLRRSPFSHQWQCQTQIEGFVFSDTLLHCVQWVLSELFALRHLVLRSVPYIRALMSQWPH